MNVRSDPDCNPARRLARANQAGAGSLLAVLVVLSSFTWVAAQEPTEPKAKEEAAQIDDGASDASDGLEDSSEEQPVAELDESDDAPASVASEGINGSVLGLPATLPEGRPLRPIGLFQSQMAELIPDHYRPVSLDRLNEAITELADRATDDQASRLKGAVYWVEVVGDKLVSDRSVIDIESDRRAEVRRSLGEVKLAIEQPQSRGTVPAIDVLPRLESEASGNLVAVFRGDATVRSGIEFKWQLRGKASGSGYEFTMQLPRTPQTRIVLSTQPGVTLESHDGVLRSRPGPPPDASEFMTDRELRWYELDAGGLTSVRIRTQNEQPATEGGSFVVRRCSVQYEADPSGLNWTCRMVVQLPPDRRFPPLAVSGTTVTGVRVNATDVPFTSKTIGGRTRHLQIDVPEGIVSASAVWVNVTLTGYATWNGKNGWCDLPMPMWMDDDVVYASAVDDVQLAVIDPLQLMSWQLPEDWNQAQEQQIDDGVMLYAGDGPPVALVTSDDRAESNTSPAVVRTWSRVRFIHRPMLQSSNTALRLEVDAGLLSAKARVAVQVDPNRIEPLRLRVESGWSLDSLTFARSGRIIENPSVSDSTRTLVLWPEAEDTDGTEIVIHAKGTRLLPGATAAITIPSTWFVRPSGVRGDLIAAVVPPADLNWSGEAAMQRGLVDRPELSEANREFFNGLGQEPLWFVPEAGRTPSVSLQTPSVSFNAATSFWISLDRGEVAETLEVEIESQGQSLKELSVHTGPAGGRPSLTWSISGSNDSPSTSLPSSDITETDGIYTIDVQDKTLRGRLLVARRRYPIEQQLELQLPSVPGAASQNSDVIVSPGLLVKQKSRAVQLVPVKRDQIQSGPGGSLRKAATGQEADVRIPASKSNLETDTARGAIRLRYDAVQQPSVTLVKSDVNPNVTIVWREQIRVIASSRGTDRIEASYKVSPTAALQIEYDPELQLTSVTRDGVAVDLISILQRPIVLQPRSETEIIHVVWNRSQYESSWIRRCRIPRIMVSGTVLKSEYHLVASTDTFAPAALMRGQFVGAGRYSAVEMQPAENVILIRRNIALAIGWLFALLVFALSWLVARRTPLVIAAGVVVLTTIVFLWWPWRLAVIGWGIVPMVAAAMLATSRAWSEAAHRSEKPTGEQKSSHPSRSTAEDLSGDFSIEALTRMMLLVVVIASGGPSGVWAQDDSDPRSRAVRFSPRPVSVLVPVDENGVFSGKMVYIPGAVHTELFQTTANTDPKDACIQSASYRVQIDSAVGGQDSIVEAEYLVHIQDGDQSTNLVRLPLAAASVRRIELIDEVSGMIPSKTNSSGQVIATLPEGNAFRLRVTFLPTITESEQWTKLLLAIPPVASSRLTVESEESMDALRVGGVDGHLLPEEDLRRWADELGPVDSLEIDYRTLVRANATVSRPLQRRYWIHAGKRQVTIDCEVEPPNAVAAGETFQFVIRGEPGRAEQVLLPNVISPSWRFDGSELNSPTRRLISFTSTRDSPGPIRLLWTQPLSLGRDDQPESVPIRIPEVIAAALGENSPAWIALHCDSALQFAPLDRDNGEPLSVDHFLAAWTGYRGRIDRAYVSLGPIPSPMLQARSASPPTVSQRHHLHVMTDRLELHYSATLTPSDTIRNQYTLRVPRDLELIHVSVNDLEIDSQPIRSRDSSELLVGSYVGAKSVTIKVIATQPLPKDMRFSPPRLVLLPEAVTSDLYTMSRDRSRMVTVLKPPAAQLIASEQMPTADSLANGWIPVATWSMQSDGSEIAGSAVGRYKVQPLKTRFDCPQLIVLSREEDQWVMETFVRFPSGRVPDFIDVEVPTRWCESLEVSPTTAWSRQPATDPSRQIIRIRCDEAELEDQTLSIRGQLQPSETGRVNVPSIRVLGAGQRQIHISVPDRLASEPVQWRTSAVEAVKLPPRWADQAMEMRSTYQVANPSWSIDLAPLPEIDADAVAISCDTQVFPQNEGALVMCHWDLFPGSLEAVDVRLPRGATCVGAWTAGKAVVAEPLESVDDVEIVLEENLLRVPLSLSRLSQPLELLLRVPASTAKQAIYLPELIGVPVTQRWLTNYVPSGSINVVSHEDVLPSRDRAVVLARSVVEAVEAVDMVDQRPRDEIAAWLQLWLARYQMIALSVGHVVDFQSRSEDPNETLNDDRDVPEDAIDMAQRLSSSSHLPWQDLDTRMAYFVDRFLSDGPTDAKRSWGDVAAEGTFLFGVADFDGFLPESVVRLSAASRPSSVQPVSSNDRGLRYMIINFLTLFLVGGLIACLTPLGRFAVPIVVHPAFWLALMGIFGFAVAPVPVAAAIVLVAVSLPVFPSKQRSSGGRVG